MKRKRAQGKDDHILFHLRIFVVLMLSVLLGVFLVLYCLFYIYVIYKFLLDIRCLIPLQWALSFGILNVEHKLKLIVEFWPYRPAGIVQKYL